MVKNEKGYVLLVVLFLVVTIMVISTTFVSASVSNAKQGKTVDENNLAVVAAEMGVDYYKTAIVNEFNKKKGALISGAQTEVDVFINSNGYKNMREPQRIIALANELVEIRKRLGPKLEGVLNTAISDVNGFTRSDVREGLKFQGKNIVANYKGPVVMEVIVNGKVHAKNDKGDKKDRILTFDMTFEVPELTMGGAGGPGGGDTGAIDMYNLYPNPIGLLDCGSILKNKECMGKSDTALKNMDNSTIYFPGNHVDPNKNNNNTDLQGSKIYIKGNFDAKNMNSMKNGTFVVGGNLEGDQFNGQGISKSNILLGGNMKVNKQMETNSSTIMMRGALHVAGHLTVVNNSKVCVEGDVTVEKGLTIDSTSKIYIYDQSWNKFSSNIKNNRQVNIVARNKTPEEFWNICQFGDGSSSTNVNINWGIPDIDVSY